MFKMRGFFIVFFLIVDTIYVQYIYICAHVCIFHRESILGSFFNSSCFDAGYHSWIGGLCMAKKLFILPWFFKVDLRKAEGLTREGLQNYLNRQKSKQLTGFTSRFTARFLQNKEIKLLKNKGIACVSLTVSPGRWSRRCVYAPIRWITIRINIVLNHVDIIYSIC